MGLPSFGPRSRHVHRCVAVLLVLAVLGSCTPSPEANVISYLLSQRLGTFSLEPNNGPPGALTGIVHHNGEPIEEAIVIVSERYGVSHTGVTDADGRYHIDGIPPGQYTPAAVAPGYDPAVTLDALGVPILATIESDVTTEAAPIELQPHVIPPLPESLAEAVDLTYTGSYTATSAYPPDSMAFVDSYTFEQDGLVNEWLRVYVPEGAQEDEEYPMLFAVYPGPTDSWEAISVALAQGGYAVVALGPMMERGIDIESHARDARIALNLALQGELGPHIAGDQAVALGGSFSSPILRRMILDEPDSIAAWIVLGGISDGYGLANDFYEGRLELPEIHNLAIPALGMPNLYPLPFLRYSSIYSAAELPPTMINHTVNDPTTHVQQAYRLEDALEEAGVPVESFYYDDESHYLQLGEYTPESSKEMYRRVMAYIEAHSDVE